MKPPSPLPPTSPAAAARAKATRARRTAEKAAALRENLARRKAQARAQTTAPDESEQKCR